MYDSPTYQHDLARRAFLRQSAYGLGAMAFTALHARSDGGVEPRRSRPQW